MKQETERGGEGEGERERKKGGKGGREGIEKKKEKVMKKREFTPGMSEYDWARHALQAEDPVEERNGQGAWEGESQSSGNNRADRTRSSEDRIRRSDRSFGPISSRPGRLGGKKKLKISERIEQMGGQSFRWGERRALNLK